MAANNGLNLMALYGRKASMAAGSMAVSMANGVMACSMWQPMAALWPANLAWRGSGNGE